jgi:hypothetical protein
VRGSIGVGVAALAAFVVAELRGRHPMVSPALFRIRAFTAANLLTFFLYAALSATLFFLPFDLIQARGYSPAAAGAAILPLVALIFLLSRAAGALADRVGALLPLTLGPAVAGVGFLLLSLLRGNATYATSVLPGLATLGLGMAFTVAPLTATVLDAVGREEEGSASGINNAVARVAALLAVAVFGVLAIGVFGRSLDSLLNREALSPEIRRAVMEERTRLGAITPPAGASALQARAIRKAVETSLGRSFQRVAQGSAALAFLASACAAWGFRGSNPRRREVAA